jgi:hypothetical protein
MGMLRYRALALVAVLLAVAAVGCGGGDDPQAGDIPAGAVAVIGDAEISESALDRQTAMLVRAQRSANDTTLSGAQREQLASQALAQLLQREALEQEAAQRGITVDGSEIRRSWRASAKRQFKTRKALRQFLGGQTVAEILAQLRLQALTERIHEQVSKQAGGGKKGAKAVEEFQKDFQKRWQDKTACSGGYTTPGCD